jgi:hypothetical protein
VQASVVLCGREHAREAEKNCVSRLHGQTLQVTGQSTCHTIEFVIREFDLATDGQVKLTYHELDRMTSALASDLQGLAVQPGDTVRLSELASGSRKSEVAPALRTASIATRAQGEREKYDKCSGL